MDAQELVRKATDIAENYTTSYIWGGLGNPLTEYTLEAALRDYPETNAGYAVVARQRMGSSKAFVFDCVGLIKAILWGWSGDFSQSRGGAIYGSNGVQDMSADHMIGLCNPTSDFDIVVPGEALWLPGHIGIYIGNGLAVEATPAFDNGVQITSVKNIATRSDYRGRYWQKHGKLPWVSYGDPVQRDIDALPSWSRPTIQKLYDRGSIRGNGVSLGLSADSIQLLVILDREGLF